MAALYVIDHAVHEKNRIHSTGCRTGQHYAGSGRAIVRVRDLDARQVLTANVGRSRAADSVSQVSRRLTNNVRPKILLPAVALNVYANARAQDDDIAGVKFSRTHFVDRCARP